MQIEIPGGTAECRDRPNMGGLKALRAKSGYMFGLMDRDSEAGGVDMKTDEGQEALTDAKISMWSEDTLAAMEDMQNLLAVTLLRSWTIPFPVPKNLDDVDAIEDEQPQAAIYAIRDVLWEDWAKYLATPSFEPNPDPKAPAASSASSNGSSADSTTPSVSWSPKSSTDGTSSSTDVSSPAPTKNT